MVTIRTTFDRPPPAASIGPVTHLRLTTGLRDQLGQLAEVSYPFEACGVLLGQAVDGLVEDSLVSVEQVLHARNLNLNLGQRPGKYILDPDDFLAANRAARANGLEIVGIWHSRPGGPAKPSTADLDTAREGDACLVVSVTAMGRTELRSWRLVSGNFQEIDLID